MKQNDIQLFLGLNQFKFKKQENPDYNLLIYHIEYPISLGRTVLITCTSLLFSINRL